MCKLLNPDETPEPYNGPIRIGVFNDVHWDPWYDPKVDSGAFCWSYDPFKTRRNLDAWELLTVPKASYGRFGCDPNKELIRTLMKKMAIDYDIEVVLMNGDLVGHDVAVKASWNLNPDQIEQHYNATKDILKGVSDVVSELFPDSVVLPSVGNNDVKFHY